MNKHQKAYKARKKATDPDYQRRENLRYQYGITVEQYEQMHTEQGGLCAVCHKPETTLDKKGCPRRLSVDHNHQTGQVRKLLCARCNTAVGLLHENPDRARAIASYLDSHIATT